MLRPCFDLYVDLLQCVTNIALLLPCSLRGVLLVLDYISPNLRSLHWLPVRRTIVFKTAVLVWKHIYAVPSATCMYCICRNSAIAEVDLTVCIDWMCSPPVLPRLQITFAPQFCILWAHSK